MNRFLDKWEHAASEGREVNAQYDLSCLAEDIIGRIGLGQHLNQQEVPQADNDYAVARDFLLKEIVLRTISPMQEHIAPDGHRKKVKQLQEEDRIRTAQMMEQAMDGIASGEKDANMVSAMKASQARGDPSVHLSDEVLIDFPYN